MAAYPRMGGLGRFSLFPPVIKSLIIINVIVFIIDKLFFSIYHIGSYSLEDIWITYFYLQPIGSGFYVWQLLTYQFIHGNIWHIFFNLLALWMFGAELESLWGSRKFILYYLLCGIGAGLTQLYIAPLISGTGPTIGASGAIYGVLLAFGLTFPDRPIFMFPFFIPIPAKFFVIIYAVLELLMGFSSSGGGVAHFAHLGGAATGFLLFKFGDKIGIYNFVNRLFRKKTYTTYSGYSTYREPEIYKVNWETPQQKPQPRQPEERKSAGGLNVNGEEITQAKIDEILDKITESGYQNLTDREKRILFELSQKLK